MSICLDTDELIELTGKKRPTAQMRALNTMGIDHMKRPDGTVAVYRDTIIPNSVLAKKKQPDFKALSDVA